MIYVCFAYFTAGGNGFCTSGTGVCMSGQQVMAIKKKFLSLPRIKFLSSNQQPVGLLTCISHFMKQLIVHLTPLPQLYCLLKLDEKLLNSFEQRFREEWFVLLTKYYSEITARKMTWGGCAFGMYGREEKALLGKRGDRRLLRKH